MKLPEIKINIDGSSDFTEESFSVGNAGIIFDILRNKLYSNAIESLCREYASNARDAMREIGNFTDPIEIHFPNAFDSNFIIKDYGPGISKNRMSDVFIKYGNSTKRNDNIQLGAYGAGCKSGFSYTNSFSIITIVKNGSVNKKGTYIAYLDDSNVGKMRMVSEEITIEPTGTSIIIPVEEKDIQAFIDGTLKSTQYWPVRPILKGINPIPEYPNSIGSLLASGENWKIYANKNSNVYNAYNRSKSESLAIIDGIQYKIDESFIDINDRWILNCNVHMFFDIGQLTLSASRETLQYDENTKKLINDRIKFLQKELSDQIIDIIDKKETYLEAVEFYTFMSAHFHKVLKNQDLTWRGHKIIGSEVNISNTVLKNINAKIYGYVKSRNNGKTSVRLLYESKINIDKNTQIYYNDLDPEHTYRNKNLKALESHSNVQIINYIKGKSYDDFVTSIKDEFIKYDKLYQTGTNAFNYYGDKNNSFIFDIIKPIKLSSVIEDKIISAPKVIKPKVINDKFSVFKLTNSYAWNLRENFIPESIEKDQEGCYIETVFSKNSCSTKYKDATWYFSAPEFSDLLKLIDGIKVFSVKEKDIPKFTKLKPLSEVIEDKFNSIINIDYYKSIAINKILSDYNGKYYNMFNSLNKLTDILPFKTKITNKFSLILEYFDYIKCFNEEIVSIIFVNKIEGYLNQKNNIKTYTKEAEILLDKMKSRYKLLDALNGSAKSEDIIDYINACDQQNMHKQFKTKLGKHDKSFDMDANGK